MILVDALFIHNGGGKVLLDYLIQELEKTNFNVFYLFDMRLRQHSFDIKPNNQFIFLEASLYKRHQFYKKNKTTFSKVFVLGNVPPTVHISADVIGYFHNAVYLDIPADFSFLDRIKYKLKIAVIKYFESNVKLWLVQTTHIKRQFEAKFSKKEKVYILPFFPKLPQVVGSRKPATFLYVSNAQANKNHKRLIDAFCKSFEEMKKGELILTVNDSFPGIQSYIEAAVAKGYPITNVGFLPKDKLAEKYAESEFLIFPSLSESFGLGIVEGINAGCKVIGADLPYLYAVCTPSATFNPYDINDISRSISGAITSNLPSSFSTVNDEITHLILLLNPNISL